MLPNSPENTDRIREFLDNVLPRVTGALPVAPCYLRVPYYLLRITSPKYILLIKKSTARKEKEHRRNLEGSFPAYRPQPKCSIHGSTYKSQTRKSRYLAWNNTKLCPEIRVSYQYNVGGAQWFFEPKHHESYEKQVVIVAPITPFFPPNKLSTTVLNPPVGTKTSRWRHLVNRSLWQSQSCCKW